MVADVQMRAEAYGLGPHLMLETERYGYRHQHHHQAQGHTGLCNDYCRARHLTAVLLIPIETSGDEGFHDLKWKEQTSGKMKDESGKNRQVESGKMKVER